MPPRTAILVQSLAARDLLTKSAYKARAASCHTAYTSKFMLNISVFWRGLYDNDHTEPKVS